MYNPWNIAKVLTYRGAVDVEWPEGALPLKTPGQPLCVVADGFFSLSLNV